MLYKIKYEDIMIKIVITLIIAVLQSLAFADCIDESNISDNYSCIEIWNPVCGCDGITYSNDCYAENAGLTEWTEGECQQLDSSIEGRWLIPVVENDPGNTMYEFLNGWRYTYYCTEENGCDTTYWNSLDTSNAIPNPNPYTFSNDTLSIDSFFGNTWQQSVTFECDGNVVSFGDTLYWFWWRVGFDISECEDQQLELSSAINSPETFRLNQNYPNPFNPITNLSYDLLEDSYVNVTIYDMLGNVINNLVNTKQSSGYKSVQWNATNNQDQPVSAGVYFYTIQVGDYRQTKKMILLK